LAQVAPQEGDYASKQMRPKDPRVVLTLKRSANGAFTCEGFIRTHDSGGNRKDGIAFSGTLYKTGVLKAKVTHPPKFKDSWTLTGSFDTKTGAIKVAVRYPARYDDENRSGYYLKNFTLTNPNVKPEAAIYWVLKDGFPKYDATYVAGPKPFTVYDNGTMVWPATSLKDGKPIAQALRFTPPKKEYKHGEKYMVTVDASGTEKGAYPFVLCIMYYGWRPGGWTGIGNDNSQFSISVGFKVTGEVTFNPSNEAEAVILVGAPGMGGMKWEYRREERQRK